jgi:uncharacterized protein YbjT (DUF2867 family)
MGLSVALFGATGLVGGECLSALLDDARFERVVALVRRPLPAALTPDVEVAKRLETHVVDVARLAEHDALLAVDRVICALGTTMRRAGSREAFRRVDHDLPLEIARLALARAVPHFLLVSALGADRGSRIFYNRVKGEVEDAVLALPFRATTIVRPSLLIGAREEVRPGELAGKALGWMVPGRWRPVHARDVARALVDEAAGDRAGARVVESEEIRAHARASRKRGQP